jgi:sulfite dehydrogenase (cytochrome) subunit A
MDTSPLDLSLDRRRWLLRAGSLTLAGLLPAGCSRRPPAASVPDDPLMRFPEKVAMRLVNDRPPCLETPWRFFQTDITPNEAFFVRWHLQAIATNIDLQTWKLRISGAVERPLELSLDELKKLPAHEVVAVNQCSGNSRGLFGPRVPGGQWANGAMGNARWTGVPLRDLLRKAGLRTGAVQVTFNGLDRGPLPTVPEFIKALDVEKCQEPDILVAYQMNGSPLPLLNGFPVRLIVPGWYATYWVKSLTDITVVDKPFDGFWMAKAYRIPTTKNAVETPEHLAEKTIPINRMNIRSFFTTPDPGVRVPASSPLDLDGIAFDGGSGVRHVAVSVDGGSTWEDAKLGDDLGRFSFRRWRLTWTPVVRGEVRLKVRATSGDGDVQPMEAGWNRGGYMRNVVEELPVTVV